MNNIKIIAEIGWNHLGNISLAKKMIKAAKKNGADCSGFPIVCVMCSIPALSPSLPRIYDLQSKLPSRVGPSMAAKISQLVFSIFSSLG